MEDSSVMLTAIDTVPR